MADDQRRRILIRQLFHDRMLRARWIHARLSIISTFHLLLLPPSVSGELYDKVAPWGVGLESRLVSGAGASNIAGWGEVSRGEDRGWVRRAVVGREEGEGALHITQRDTCQFADAGLPPRSRSRR